MRTHLTSILSLALLSACHDGSTPTTPVQPLSPSAPQRALIVSGLTDVGTLGGDFASPTSINDFGQIVGSWGNTAGGSRAFLWGDGAATDLVTPSLSSVSQAYDVDNLGRVVGVIDNRATLWENGTQTPLGELAAGFSAANAINDRGQIAGNGTNAAGQIRGVLWNDGVPSELGTLGGDVSAANAINDAGLIVGQANNSAGESRPAVWTTGAATDLGTLGGPSGIAFAINDLGQIVGSSASGTDDVRHATLWQNGGVTDLGSPSGWLSQAEGINELGQIVGWSADLGTSTTHALLWMDGTFFELGAPAGMSKGIPVAINNLGEVVGYTDSPSHVVRWQVALRAAIDAVPGDATNVIRAAGGGTVSVTVFGSRWFDATQIDARTVTLGNEDATDTPVARKKTGQPTATLRDVNRDGYADLSLEFDKKQMTVNGELTPSTTQLVLLGSRIDGRRVRGVDRVTVQ